MLVAHGTLGFPRTPTWSLWFYPISTAFPSLFAFHRPRLKFAGIDFISGEWPFFCRRLIVASATAETVDDK